MYLLHFLEDLLIFPWPIRENSEFCTYLTNWYAWHYHRYYYHCCVVVVEVVVDEVPLVEALIHVHVIEPVSPIHGIYKIVEKNIILNNQCKIRFRGGVANVIGV